MRKIFSLLAVASLLFVACETVSEEYTSSIRLSKSVVEFGKAGGTQSVAFTIENSKGGRVTAEDNADWVDAVVDFNAEVIITVDANTGDAREATVTVNYEHAKAVEITVKQKSADSRDFDVEFEANRFEGIYFGTDYSSTPNYYVILSDRGAMSDGTSRSSATYYYLDMYHRTSANSENPVLPNGEYSYDTSNSFANLTISEENSWYCVTNESGENAVAKSFKSVTATVSNNNFEAIIELSSGELHKVTFSGELVTLINFYSSTFTGDVEFSVDGATITASLYGDSYEVGQQNWFIEAKKGNELFMVEVFNSSTEKCDGLYQMLVPDSSNYANTYIPGMVNNGLIGTWYATVTNGKISGDSWAPMAEGVIRLATSGNALTIEYGCKDDAGNNITGSVSGTVTVKDLRE
ncbi:MAG: BACON domain-containing protein [Alistipes sp.]|nr:BACON domain-containing protein [Alistipes sp.]